MAPSIHNRFLITFVHRPVYVCFEASGKGVWWLALEGEGVVSFCIGCIVHTYLQRSTSLPLHLGDLHLHPLWDIRDGISHSEFNTQDNMLLKARQFG